MGHGRQVPSCAVCLVTPSSRCNTWYTIRTSDMHSSLSLVFSSLIIFAFISIYTKMPWYVHSPTPCSIILFVLQQHTRQLGYFNLGSGGSSFLSHCWLCEAKCASSKLQSYPCTYIHVNVTCRPSPEFTTDRKSPWDRLDLGTVENAPKAYLGRAILTTRAGSGTIYA